MDGRMPTSVTQTDGSWTNRPAFISVADPFDGIVPPVWVSVACVVDQRLHLAHQLTVWLSVFLVVGAPGAGGVEFQPGFRAL